MTERRIYQFSCLLSEDEERKLSAICKTLHQTKAAFVRSKIQLTYNKLVKTNQIKDTE